MIKPGNGGYNIGGDCEKGSGSVANCLGLYFWRVYVKSGKLAGQL